MDPHSPDSRKTIKRAVGLTLFLSFAVPAVLFGLALVLGWRETAVWALLAAAAVASAAWHSARYWRL